jgi:hypothetical protein
VRRVGGREAGGHALAELLVADVGRLARIAGGHAADSGLAGLLAGAKQTVVALRVVRHDRATLELGALVDRANDPVITWVAAALAAELGKNTSLPRYDNGSSRDPRFNATTEGTPMTKGEGRSGGSHKHGGHEGGGDDGDDDGKGDGGDGDDEGEETDDPNLHKEIDRARFRGGLPATPDLYARGRVQWYRLPGSLVRPSMASAEPEAKPDEETPGDRLDDETSAEGRPPPSKDPKKPGGGEQR